MTERAYANGDLDKEPLGRPMLAALVFHGLLIGGGIGFALLQNLFPHHSWGGPSDGGAIAVQLVSNALPLPSDYKPNDNVLATEKPSDTPAPPAPRSKATVDETAIPIPVKADTAKKQADKRQEANNPAKPSPITPTGTSHSPQPVAKVDNKAQFGEQSSSQVQRAVQPANTTTIGPASVSSGGTKGFNYPWYVEGIVRKMQQNLNRGEVDTRTPHGTQSNILFTIRRDGSVMDAKMDKASGSQTLDRACIRAAQRVDTFGPLPSPNGDGPLIVSYHCDY